MTKSKLSVLLVLTGLLLLFFTADDLYGQSGYGGLIGFNEESIIGRSYSSGNITGESGVGGFVGINTGTITNSYSLGAVVRLPGEEEDAEDIGGFCGHNNQGIITNSYSIVSVAYEDDDNPTNKGFCGAITDGGNYEMTGNYWDTEASGQTATAGNAAGRTTEQMTYPYGEDVYAGWDFEDIWLAAAESENDGYPYLHHQYYQFYTPAVRNLRATAGNRQVTLRWDNPDDNPLLELLGYRVLRDSVLITGDELVLERFYEDSGEIENGEWYRYQVQAVYDLRESLPSHYEDVYVNPASWLMPLPETFPESMVLSGFLHIDSLGTALEDDRYWVGVFGPGGVTDCRGMAQNGEDGFVISHVYGDEDEANSEFSIRVFDAAAGNSYRSNQTVEFQPGGNQGDTNVIFNTRYNLTVSVQGQGQTVPRSGTSFYPRNDDVRITATASEGWTFSHWIINQEQVDESAVDLVMNRNHNAKAVFNRNQHDLTISTVGEGTTQPGAGVHQYGYGEIVQVTATADSSHRFDRWVVGDEVFHNRRLNMRITGDTAITGHFRPVQVSGITLSKNTFLVTETDEAHYFDLSAAVYPRDALDREVVWSSSDSTLAIPSVSEDDPLSVRVNIPALEERRGAARINVLSADGEISASCLVVAARTVIDDEPVEENLTVEDHPYLVRGDIDLAGRPRLTIDEGVVLYFEEDTAVNVESQLIANNVTFSGPSGTQRSRWQGLYFGENSEASRIDGATIINALEPVTIAGDTLNLINVAIDGGEYEYESFAVQVYGAASPHIDSLYIDGYENGISLNAVGTGQTSTATLSNIRVRHTSESIRPETTGIDIRGSVDARISNLEAANFQSAIVIENPQDNRLVSTVEIDSVQVYNYIEDERTAGVGLFIGGNVLAGLSNIGIDNYSKGLVIKSTYSGESTTTLTNIRVRHTSESIREPGVTGVYLENIPFIDFGTEEDSHNEIFGFSTGLHIKADELQRSVTTASAANIHVGYDAEGVRNDLKGIFIEGNVNAEFTDMLIEDFDTGVHYDNTLEEGVAAFSNMTIVYNPDDDNSLGTTGLLFENMNELDLVSAEDDQIEIVGYSTGIHAETLAEDAGLTTATLTNIRVRHTSESIRNDLYGVLAEGNINLAADELDIIDYPVGLKHAGGFPESISIVNNTAVLYRPAAAGGIGSVGMHFVDIDSLSIGALGECSIENYITGIHVERTEPDRRNMTIISLENTEIQGGTQRLRGIETRGGLLSGSIEGLFFANEIRDYDIGLQIVDNNSVTVRNNLFVDCTLGMLMRGENLSSVLRNNILKLPSVYQVQKEAAAFIAESMAAPTINNNTAYLYPAGLISDAATVDFFNNIIWQDAHDQAIVYRNEGQAEISYNNISYTLYPGQGNISADPLFNAPDEGDFSLMPESPCIDAGDPEYEPDEDGTVADIGAVPYLRAAEPVFSHYSDVFYEPIQLTMTCDTEGTRIFYTTDGEEPTEQSLLYTEPLEISNTTTVRARAFFIEEHDWHPSFVSEETYIEALGPDIVGLTVSADEVVLEWEKPGIWGDRRSNYPDRMRNPAAERSCLRNTGCQERSLDGFNLYRRRDDQDEFTGVNEAAIDTTAYRDDNLAAGVYHYYLTAIYFDDTEVSSDTIRVSLKPQMAVSPSPAHDTTEVSIGLESLRWSYIADSVYADPLGFRVYFSDEEEFDDDFEWVAYEDGETEYSTIDILPEELDYFTDYYWKVVPTTIDPERAGGSDGKRERRREPERVIYSQNRGDAENVSVWTFKTEQYPNPVIAVNPVPVNDTTDVSVDLESLQWSYIVDSTHVNPLGFRVYFSDTDEFDDDFVWVAFDEDEENYSTAAALPEELDYFADYYWKVVPTTIDPDDRSGGRSRRRSLLATRHSPLSTRGDAENVPVWTFRTEQYPNPVIAVNPVPVNDTTDVSVDLESLQWSYIVDSTHVKPLGFRVYFSDTDEFDDDFVWVAFDEDEENYSTAAALPEELDYFADYYWKVVPTTIDPDDRSGGRSRRNSQLATHHSQLSARGDAENVPIWTFRTEEDTSVEIEKPQLITELQRNYPNPFNPSTTIDYSLNKDKKVVIEIFDIRGRKIVTLYDGVQQAGSHSVVWKGQDERGNTVSSGIYFYRMRAGNYSVTKKMLITK